MTDFFRDQTEDHIQRFGRSVVAVGPGPKTPFTFAYSIGNAMKGLPEILVIGLDPWLAQGLINRFSQDMIKAGGSPDVEAAYSFGGPHPVWLIEAGDAAKADYTIQAGQYLGTEDYRVIQIVLCDRHGKFPWDDGCDPLFATQPILRKVHA